MTNEEAKRRMEICRDFLANNYSDMGEPNFTAFNMAIKALEQEPCEDCISREAVINYICEGKECYKEDCKGKLYKRCPDLQWVYNLPSVTPKAEFV